MPPPTSESRSIISSEASSTGVRVLAPSTLRRSTRVWSIACRSRWIVPGFGSLAGRDMPLSLDGHAFPFRQPMLRYAQRDGRAFRLHRGSAPGRHRRLARRGGARALRHELGREALERLPRARAGRSEPVRDLRRRRPRLPPDRRGRRPRLHDHERLQAVRARARLRGARCRRGAQADRRQRDGARLQLVGRDRAERRRSDEPDGEPGRDRDHESRARHRRRPSGGGRSRTASPRSRAGRSRSTPRSMPPPRRRITGTRPPPGSSRASAASTSIRRRRSTSTRGSARSS